jgi:uncharacterized protein YbaR (Trm112 family)
MPVDAELLEILVCPESHQPLRMAPADVLAAVNARIASGQLRNHGGDPVRKQVVEGLVREDGKRLYVVDDGIPVMLIEESIAL